MPNNVPLIVFPVSDIDAAKTFYGAFLGAEPYADGPYYAGYRIGDLEIGLDPNATAGPIAYTDVDDVNAALEALTGAGAEVVQEPRDVGNGLLIAQLKDPAGNVVGLRQQP